MDRMGNIVGIRFKKPGKIYFFDPGEFELSNNDFVIVETSQGEEYGRVVIANRNMPDEKIVKPLKKVIRKATSKDTKHYEENKQKEKEAFDICQKKIKEHKLDMTLTDVEFKFDNSKVLFYFTADGRIDFRDLVKDLAAIFRTRIELRQIGVRDEVKRIGGNGVCGRELCCCSFLSNFETVSIKMAKEQNMSLNPSKISGNCGRLMCCLKYEQEAYEEKIKRLPQIGAIVKTEDGEGTVDGVETLKERIRVKLKDAEGEYFYKKYDAKDVKIIKNVANTEVDPEEKEHMKELQELEKLEKMDKSQIEEDDL
jgi:cell fate regulator YaaT (PSP1 superfamily)